MTQPEGSAFPEWSEEEDRKTAKTITLRTFMTACEEAWGATPMAQILLGEHLSNVLISNIAFKLGILPEE